MSGSISRALALLFLSLSFSFALAAPQAEAQRYPAGMKEGRNSARTPQVAGEVIRFTLMPGDCQARSYGDGRGESDCGNLNAKSYLSAGEVKSGATMLYAFEVRVAGGLTHAAFHNPRAVPFTGGPDSRLAVALWQGELIKNHLVSLELDRTRGLTFLGRSCAGPGQLGGWTRFELLVRWSAGADGVMQARCNGRTIYAVSGQPTDQNPHCHEANHCEPGKVKHPRRINAGFGLFFDKEVVNGRPMRPRIPPSGLSVDMRNFKIAKARLK
ncbi:hypothetical protein [Vannielia litorea]|uniref:Uncharacterized protein n=1 Tax=Vannielia litorea TaxID=1217970 RepID=A0A1N6GN50_9RHOB|nr:hypothetical protein [Vannielia litorea]SIO08960.1 hypothetical protein SAMN05444002_2634 [Vannielia litorea]